MPTAWWGSSSAPKVISANHGLTNSPTAEAQESQHERESPYGDNSRRPLLLVFRGGDMPHAADRDAHAAHGAQDIDRREIESGDTHACRTHQQGECLHPHHLDQDCENLPDPDQPSRLHDLPITLGHKRSS